MNIGETIRKIRKEKKLSQQDLAYLCSISSNAICQIERDHAFPKQETIKMICKVLEIPVAYLLLSCIEEKDVPADRQFVFSALKKLMADLLLNQTNTPNI